MPRPVPPHSHVHVPMASVDRSDAMIGGGLLLHDNAVHAVAKIGNGFRTFLILAYVGNTNGDYSTILGSLPPVLVCFCVEHPFYTPPFIGPV